MTEDRKSKIKKSSKIRKALEFMIEAHSGVYRKFSGEEYAHHPVGVAKIVRSRKKSKNKIALIIAALLHDVVEDTDITLEEIKELFGELVSSIVGELSNDPVKMKEMGKANYLSEKMVSMSSYALLIKLADRLHNTEDLSESSDKFRDNYVPQTRFILNNLLKKRHLTEPQKLLIKDIEEKINPYEN